MLSAKSFVMGSGGEAGAGTTGRGRVGTGMGMGCDGIPAAAWPLPPSTPSVGPFCPTRAVEGGRRALDSTGEVGGIRRGVWVCGKDRAVGEGCCVGERSTEETEKEGSGLDFLIERREEAELVIASVSETYELASSDGGEDTRRSEAVGVRIG